MGGTGKWDYYRGALRFLGGLMVTAVAIFVGLINALTNVYADPRQADLKAIYVDTMWYLGWDIIVAALCMGVLQLLRNSAGDSNSAVAGILMLPPVIIGGVVAVHLGSIV